MITFCVQGCKNDTQTMNKSAASSFRKTSWFSAGRPREGGREVTQGMSLKGSQTGNTRGCCQDVFVQLNICACEHIYSKLHPEQHFRHLTFLRQCSIHSSFLFPNSGLGFDFISQYSSCEGSRTESCQHYLDDWSLTFMTAQLT